MGNVGIYSVDAESVFQIVRSGRTEMSCGCLAGRLYPRDTRETQLSPSVLTLRIPIMCKAHASSREKLSRKIPAKIFFASIA